MDAASAPAFFSDDGALRSGEGTVDAAGDRRRRSGVQRDDEPGGRDRRRPRDGVRAGAAVADLEFVQFHPTALNVPGQPRFLLSEALRGEGARLLNSAGEPFMARYDQAGDLAPRDRVARAIVRESERTGGAVYLSLEHLDPDFVHARFPLISDACRRAGLDLASDRVPVGPAAHYVMGGV